MKVVAVDLHEPPASHATGPIYLNVLKTLDVPQAMAMAAARGKVRVYSSDESAWRFTAATARQFGGENAFEIRNGSKTE